MTLSCDAPTARCAARLSGDGERPRWMCHGWALLALFVTLLWLALVAAMGCPPPVQASESTPTVGEGQQVSEGSLVDDDQGIGINGFERRNKGTSKGEYGYVFPLNDAQTFAVLATDAYTLVMVPQDVADEVGFKADDPAYTNAFMAMVDTLDKSASRGGLLVGDLDVPVIFSVGQNEVELDGVIVRRDVDIDGRFYLTVTRTDGAANKDGIVCLDYGTLVPTSAVNVERVPSWWERLGAFLSTIDYRPLWVSLKTSFTALAVVFVLGLLAAWKSLGVTSRWKGMVDTLFTIPMVLPPTVCGFLLLLAFGNATPFGQWLLAHGIKLVFSWPATVIAACVVAFPLMYRTARGAFEALDANMLDAARTLGWSEGRIFLRLMVPLAWPSIAAGTVLAFARAMGEFGATLFCAGNYAGVTQTMPIAIYFQWMGGNTDVAIFWVIVVILISFLVILFINLYSSHSQRYREGGLTRAERKQLKRDGKLAGAEGIASDQAFGGIQVENAEELLGDIGIDSANYAYEKQVLREDDPAASGRREDDGR